MKKLAIALLLFVSLPVNAESFDVPMRYVYDGDSIMISLPQLPIPLNNASVRINGIDAPEIKGKCASEIEQAKKAKEFMKTLIGDAKTLTLTNFKWDKYGGRVNATVIVNGKDIASEMIAAGHVRSYTGGRRAGWCK